MSATNHPGLYRHRDRFTRLWRTASKLLPAPEWGIGREEIRSGVVTPYRTEGGIRYARIGAKRPVTVSGSPLLDNIMQSLVAHDEAGSGGFARAAAILQIGQRLTQIALERLVSCVIEPLREWEKVRILRLQVDDDALGEPVVVCRTRLQLHL
jgi:hypothetical protein